jgi:hypothetical protein
MLSLDGATLVRFFGSVEIGAGTSLRGINQGGGMPDPDFVLSRRLSTFRLFPLQVLSLPSPGSDDAVASVSQSRAKRLLG